MSRVAFNRLVPKFKQDQCVSIGEDQEFEISFVEWDFDREEYYYFTFSDIYAGKNYEN